jgi:hypothetical protein
MQMNCSSSPKFAARAPIASVPSPLLPGLSRRRSGPTPPIRLLTATWFSLATPTGTENFMVVSKSAPAQYRSATKARPFAAAHTTPEVISGAGAVRYARIVEVPQKPHPELYGKTQVDPVGLDYVWNPLLNWCR